MTAEPRTPKFRFETLDHEVYKLGFSGIQLSMYQVRKMELGGKHTASEMSIKKGTF